MDPDPGSGEFLNPGPGWVKNHDPDLGSGMNIPDHISESLETIFGLKILKFFDVDPDPGSGVFLTPASGMGTNHDPDPG